MRRGRYPASLKVRRYVAWALLAMLSLTACTAAGSITPTPRASTVAANGTDAPASDATGRPAFRERMRIVALGDGYTAGTTTDAPNRDSWPAQLVQLINRSRMQLQLLGYNLAEASSTSENVLKDQLPQVESYQPDIVVLQVGVNDIWTSDEFTSAGVERYRSNLSAILDGLLEILPPERIFVITTPDHDLTDRGPELGPLWAGSTDVARANAVLAEVADERGIPVVDIAPVYRMVVDDPGLVLEGGPYPSARQYAGWVEIIGQEIQNALSSE